VIDRLSGKRYLIRDRRVICELDDGHAVDVPDALAPIADLR
jgi:hypothetical protein